MSLVSQLDFSSEVNPLWKTPLVTGRQKLVWRVVVLALVVASLLLAGTGYRHGLPFIDEPDEMTIWTMGRAYLDPSWTMFQPDQPPALLRLSEVIQRAQIAAGDQFPNIAVTVEIMRLLSVIMCALTTLVVIVLAYRFAGPLAGAFAGLFWLIFPWANQLSKLSTHNLWLTAFFIFAVAAAVEGWTRKSVGWILLSLTCAIISGLFKWQGLAALSITGLATLTFWKTDRRKMIGIMAIYAAVVVAFAYWMIFIHKVLEGDSYLPGMKPTKPSLATIGTNLFYTFFNLGPALIWLVVPVIGLVIIALIPSLRRRLYGQMGLWAFPIVVLAFTVIVSFQGAPVYDRHYLAIFPLLAVLAGIGLSYLIALTWQWGKTNQKSVAMAVIVVVLLITSVPTLQMFNTSLLLAQNVIKPDRHNVLADWVRTSATDGAIYVVEPATAVALQTLYGYRGRPIDTPYNADWNLLVSYPDLTPEKIAEKNIRYLVAPSDSTPKIGTLKFTPLISSPKGSLYRGTEWVVYYIGGLPAVEAQPLATFGDELSLRGMALSHTTICRGSASSLQFLWSALRTPSYYYSTFVHLFSEQTGELSEPFNGDPLAIGDRPTVSWTNPDEVLVGPQLNWTVRPDLPVGTYDVRLGVYEPIKSNRLRLTDGKDYFVLAQIHVIDCAALPAF